MLSNTASELDGRAHVLADAALSGLAGERVERARHVAALKAILDGVEDTSRQTLITLILL